MKRIVMLLSGCVTVLVMSGNVSAEAFNDRGVNWITAAPTGSSQAQISVKPRLAGFKGRVNWVKAIPDGSSQPPVSVKPHLAGFNDHGFDPVTAVSSDTNGPHFAIVLNHR